MADFRANYLTARGQAERFRQLAFERKLVGRTPEEERELSEAYLWLGQNAMGQRICDHLFEKVWQDCEGPHDEGARRFAKQLLDRVIYAALDLKEG